MKTSTLVLRQNKRGLFCVGFFLFFFILITIVWPTSKWYLEQGKKFGIEFPSLHQFLAKPGITDPFKESAFAHKLLDGMKGVEIGASKHNPFGLNTINVDNTDQMDVFRQEQINIVGSYAKVDIIAPGDKLPFTNDSQDFVINSHVLEHFYDPIKAINEWLRIVRPGGYVFMLIPHKERTFDKDSNRTTLSELLERQNKPIPETHGHFSVWIMDDILELCQHFNWTVAASLDPDDKVGNGFMVVIQK